MFLSGLYGLCSLLFWLVVWNERTTEQRQRAVPVREGRREERQLLRGVPQGRNLGRRGGSQGGHLAKVSQTQPGALRKGEIKLIQGQGEGKVEGERSCHVMSCRVMPCHVMSVYPRDVSCQQGGVGLVCADVRRCFSCSTPARMPVQYAILLCMVLGTTFFYLEVVSDINVYCGVSLRCVYAMWVAYAVVVADVLL